MDVTRTPLPGMTPLLAYRTLLRAADVAASAPRAAAAGATAPAATASGGGTVGMDPPEIDGVVDGADVVLATGVHIRRKRIGSARVGDAELQQAIRGVQALPVSHQILIARLGLPIELIPVVQLERVIGTTDPVVGATRITGPDGGLRPGKIRIAAYQSHVNSSVTECTQHEIGHAIAVTASQDTSEETAIRYARTY
ncbi:MAG: hypothetical protein JWL76_662 [Thermoleophilia bacterium]|nr:hypothetical protein [Thermoleophilia bacterium]